MLSVDLVRKIVFEYRGVDSGRVPPRCKRIAPEELEEFAIAGFRYFDLSEFALVEDDRVLGMRSYGSRADAEYELRRRGSVGGTVRRVVDIMEIL